MSGVTAGFYGKLPSRGDFVQAGLPRDFVAPWDRWWQHALAAARDADPGWVDAWLEAPIWRFRLAQGVCGTAAVLGAWMPSVDRVGRYFPLTVAMTGPEAALPDAFATDFLDLAEAAALEALAHDLDPAVLAARVAAACGGGAQEPTRQVAPLMSLWWTTGAPRVPAAQFVTTGLPPFRKLASMLDAHPVIVDTGA
jgi:type VI secretion system protein ImpM